MYRISYFPLDASYYGEDGRVKQHVEDFKTFEEAADRFKELDKNQTTVYLSVTNNV